MQQKFFKSEIAWWIHSSLIINSTSYRASVGEKVYSSWTGDISEIWLDSKTQHLNMRIERLQPHRRFVEMTEDPDTELLQYVL